MKAYGLRIGGVGVEFSTREDREKALLMFCRGGCVAISDTEGVRYSDGDGTFATYERNTEKQLTNCSICKGVFPVETCSKRSFARKDWDSKFPEKDDSTTAFICDGCLAARVQEKKVHDAEKTLSAAEPAV